MENQKQRNAGSRDIGWDAAAWLTQHCGPDALQLSQSCHPWDIIKYLFRGTCSISESTCDEEMQPDGRTQSPPLQSLTVPSGGRGERGPRHLCCINYYQPIGTFPVFLSPCLPISSPLLPSTNKARFCSRELFLNIQNKILLILVEGVQPEWSKFIDGAHIFSDKECSENSSSPHKPRAAQMSWHLNIVFFFPSNEWESLLALAFSSLVLQSWGSTTPAIMYRAFTIFCYV